MRKHCLHLGFNEQSRTPNCMIISRIFIMQITHVVPDFVLDRNVECEIYIHGKYSKYKTSLIQVPLRK